MDESGVQLVGFEMRGEKFAFDVTYLVEIVRIFATDVTPFVSQIPLIRGKWDYRGTLLYVIDLREFFELLHPLTETEFAHLRTLPPIEKQEQSQRGGNMVVEPVSRTMLVINIQGRLFGLLTDAVYQVMSLGAFYEYPHMISTLPQRYFSGITVLNTELILLLAVEKFISDDECDTLFNSVTD